MVDGVAQKPIEGVSMAYTWDQANADTPSTRTTQYFEMMGNRALYHDGWIATTTPPAAPWFMGLGQLPDVVNGYKWELYNLAEDFSEANDLASTMPDKLRELQQLFLVEAAKYQVLPLDNDVLQRVLAPKPSYTAGRTEFTYASEVSGTPNSDSPNTLAKSYTITAEVDIPQGGAEGMLVTGGGRFGGYGLYLLKGKPMYVYNLLGLERFRWEAKEVLAPGKHTIVFDFKYDGPGFGKGGAGILSVDGKEIDSKKIPHTIPFLLTFDESFDVGVDTRTGVDDSYALPFPLHRQAWQGDGEADSAVTRVGEALGPQGAGSKKCAPVASPSLVKRGGRLPPGGPRLHEQLKPLPAKRTPNTQIRRWRHSDNGCLSEIGVMLLIAIMGSYSQFCTLTGR